MGRYIGSIKFAIWENPADKIITEKIPYIVKCRGV